VTQQLARQYNLFEVHPAAVAHDEWTFNRAPTRMLTHCYHDYPARMIPQVAGKCIETYGRSARLLFDPYCGTGTSMVEAVVRGMDAVGTDLNPLARLIAEAKTATPSLGDIDSTMAAFKRARFAAGQAAWEGSDEVRGINVAFWFKDYVVVELAAMRRFVDSIPDGQTALFFRVAFSETVRESSNTRVAEFKLFRYAPDKLVRFKPDPWKLMSLKLARNRAGLADFLEVLLRLRRAPQASVYGFNTVLGIPNEVSLKPGGVDLVVTSPPYGDSRTTVAYGQYSRLSAAWLGMDEHASVDRMLMGGRPPKSIVRFGCAPLDDAIAKIAESDFQRALDVVSFYVDLRSSIAHVGELVAAGGHACYVVGNRKVKGVVLPTDTAIRYLFAKGGFEHAATHTRSIPNKRMPLRNSPSNITGQLDATMTREFIVVMRKPSLTETMLPVVADRPSTARPRVRRRPARKLPSRAAPKPRETKRDVRTKRR